MQQTQEPTQVSAPHLDGAHSDSSSTTSQQENRPDSQADNFLKHESRAFCGLVACIERVPLWIKLLIITVFASIIITAFAAWLIALQVLGINEAMVTKKFSDDYNVYAALVGSLQAERASFASYIASPTATVYNNFAKTMNDTNNNAKKLSNVQGWDKTAGIRNGEANLMAIRAAYKTIDPLYMFTWYSDYIAALASLIAYKAKNTGQQKIILIHSLFFQLRESRGQVRTFGALAFANKNATLNEAYYSQFRKLIEVRETLNSVFASISSDSINQYVNETFFSLPEYRTVVTLENTALASNISYFSSSVSPSAWVSNYAVTAAAIQKIYAKLLSDVLVDADNLYNSSIGLLVLILLLAVIFILLFSLLSLFLSTTIVGPWVRMNKLQDEVMNKFVPRQFLKLLNIERITSAKLAVMATKPITMMKITINNIWQVIDDLPCKGRIDFLNRIVGILSPIIRNYNGYVESFSADEIIVFFRAPQGCMSCANKIHKAVKNYNSLYESQVEISTVIHGGKQIHMAVAGDENRMQGVILSKLASELRYMSNIAKRFKCNTIVSNFFLDMLGEKRSDIQLLAMHSQLVLYEVLDSARQKTKDEFSKAVRDIFVDNNIEDALLNLKGLNSEAAQFYTKVCVNETEQMYREATQLCLNDLIKSPDLEHLIEAACEKEQCKENLRAYRLVLQYEEAFRANNKEGKAISVAELLKLTQELNLSDMMKTGVVQALQEPSDNWKQDMLESLKLALSTQLTDICSRVKQSEDFKREYLKKKEIKSDLLEEVFRYG